MIAAMLGLAAILHTSALAFAALKWCGVVYLLYMAWQALRETGALAVNAEAAPERSSRRVIVTAILINILNPKLSIFFLAFLPQFIAVDEAYPLARMLELSGVFMAMTFAVFAVYGLFAAGVRDRVITRPRVMAWLRRSFAAGFAALGAKLAFAERYNVAVIARGASYVAIHPSVMPRDGLLRFARNDGEGGSLPPELKRKASGPLLSKSIA